MIITRLRTIKMPCAMKRRAQLKSTVIIRLCIYRTTTVAMVRNVNFLLTTTVALIVLHTRYCNTLGGTIPRMAIVSLTEASFREAAGLGGHRESSYQQCKVVDVSSTLSF